jgi:psiF repeat
MEDTMNAIVIATFLTIVCLTAALAHAADKAMTPQQEKMKACNAKAGDQKLEGDARKAFMTDCLKAGTPASQPDKMKACNKDASAKALKGEDRKAFMSRCLSGEKKSRGHAGTVTALL